MSIGFFCRSPELVRVDEDIQINTIGVGEFFKLVNYAPQEVRQQRCGPRTTVYNSSSCPSGLGTQRHRLKFSPLDVVRLW